MLLRFLMPLHCYRSSYPDHREGEDPEEAEQLPSEKNLEYDEETMELILPSGEFLCQKCLARGQWD